MQTGGKQWAINAGSKLLATRVKGIHTGRAWRRLNNTGVRVSLHQTHQATQAVTGHHGVCIQHHHVAVLAAPAAAEVIDVTAFTLHAAATTTIEDLPFALHLGNQLHPRLLLCYADIGVVAVAENIDVEVLGVTRCLYRLPCRTQTGEDAIDVLVTDRHDQRGTVLRVERLIPNRRR